MICAKCGQELQEGMNFCTSCGSKVEPEVVEEVVAEETVATDSADVRSASCAVCGAPLMSGARVCAFCGTPIDADAADEIAPMPEVVAETAPTEAVYAPPVAQASEVAAAPAVAASASDQGRSMRLIIIGVVCAAVVIAAIVIALLFLSGSEDASTETSNGASPAVSAQVASASNEAGVTADKAENEDGTSGDAPVFTGVNTSGAPQSAAEAAQDVENVFQGTDVTSMVYTMDDGSSVMVITQSDSFGNVTLSVQE